MDKAYWILHQQSCQVTLSSSPSADHHRHQVLFKNLQQQHPQHTRIRWSPLHWFKSTRRHNVGTLSAQMSPHYFLPSRHPGWYTCSDHQKITASKKPLHISLQEPRPPSSRLHTRCPSKEPKNSHSLLPIKISLRLNAFIPQTTMLLNDDYREQYCRKHLHYVFKFVGSIFLCFFVLFFFCYPVLTIITVK